nr:hypothetical protein HmN_000464500 [Hymenolepis microstoma]
MPLVTISATLPKEPEPSKTPKSGFVRNSSIRLSDTRVRRSMRESAKTENEKPKEPPQIEVLAAAQPAKSTTSKALESPKEEKTGFVRNSSIRLSDTRSSRSGKENKIPTEQSKEADPSAPKITTPLIPVETTPSKAAESIKSENSRFVRNSNIRLSDTRARRSIREKKSDVVKGSPVTGAVFTATAPVAECEEAKKTEKAPKPTFQAVSNCEHMDGSSDIDDDNPPYKGPSHEDIISTPVKVEMAPPSRQNDGKDSDLSTPITPAGDQEYPTKYSISGESGSEEEEERKVTKIIDRGREKYESESERDSITESLGFSADSAHGDSILPTVDDSSYSQPKKNPRLVLIDPQEGSTKGGYEICLYGVDLDESVMLHAQVFVDVYAVSSADWRVIPGKWPNLSPDATHCLRIRVPEMPPGEAWIELETIRDGRLQCPRPFVFSDKISSMKYSMRGMGALEQGSIRQPASSFADFELTPKIKDKVANPPLLRTDKEWNLDSAKAEIANLSEEVSRLKLELQNKSKDEILISRQLCLLRSRLLEDGQLKYLEKT